MRQKERERERENLEPRFLLFSSGSPLLRNVPSIDHNSFALYYIQLYIEVGDLSSFSLMFLEYIYYDEIIIDFLKTSSLVFFLLRR